jgi:hypothetical protein
MKKHFKLIIFIILTLACGKEKTIVLPENVAVTTVETSEITSAQAKAKGSVKIDGKAAVKSHGHCWSATIAEPTPTNSSKTDLGPIEAATNFTSELRELKTNTTYYVRAYAFTQAGTYYGKVLTFKTSDLRGPTVTTADAINLGSTTAGSNGQVSDLGTSPVTAYGHVLSQTTQNPTIADVKIDYGALNTAPKDFTSNFSNLKSNTIYYVRAFATSTVATSYGKTVTFTTKAIAIPTVETNDIGAITTNSFAVFGKITNVGGDAVSQHGFCWSITNPLPDFGDPKNQLGGANGAINFNSTIDGLTPNTSYYVRSYATNSGGTAFGKTLTVKTSQIVQNVNLGGQFWFGLYNNGPNSGFDQTTQANGILFNADGTFDFYSIIGFEKVGNWTAQGKTINLFSEKYGINTSLDINGNTASNFSNKGRTLLSSLEKSVNKYDLQNTTWELKIIPDSGDPVIQTLIVKDNKFSLASISRAGLTGDVYVFYNTVYFVATSSKSSDRIYVYITQNAAGSQIMKGGYLTTTGLYELSGIRK